MVEYGAEVQQREISHANNNKTVQTACGTNSPADLSASCGTYGRAVGLYARLNKGVENKIKKRKKYPPLSTYPPLFYPYQTALPPHLLAVNPSRPVQPYWISITRGIQTWTKSVVPAVSRLLADDGRRDEDVILPVSNSWRKAPCRRLTSLCILVLDGLQYFAHSSTYKLTSLKLLLLLIPIIIRPTDYLSFTEYIHKHNFF